MRLTSSALVFLAACSVCLFSAAGDERPDPKAAYADALKRAREGRVQEAVDIWLDIVDRIEPRFRPDVCKALGLGYRKLERFEEAWYWLTAYLKTTTREDRKSAAWLEDTEKRLTEAHVKVGISCQPEGTRVWLARDRSGPSYPCPLSWWFKPGKAFVHAENDGFAPKTQELDIRERGADAAYIVSLEPEAPAVAAVPAPAPVPAPPQSGPTAPPRPSPVSPAPVRVTKAAEAPAPDDTWKWVVLGGSAGLLAVGGVAHAIAYSNNEDLHDRYPADPTDPDYKTNREKYNDGYTDSVLPLEITAWSQYVMGGAGVLFAASALLFPDWWAPLTRPVSGVPWSPARPGSGIVLEVDF